MDGFKNSTRVQYMKGGSCEGYAKGGSVKGAAKINKVMGEFKRGELHSGSKEGPKVSSKKQATAIALSEARKAGAKIPQPVQKKSLGGVIEAMSPLAAVAGPAALLGGAGLLISQLLKKKQEGTITPAESQKLAAAQAQQGQTAMKKGGAVKKKFGGMMNEGVSARPTDSKGRRVTLADLEKSNRDTGGMTAAQIKAAGEAIGRGNRTPRERIPTDAEAARTVGRPIRRKAGGGVGSYNSQPLVGKGGLSVMPRSKK